MLRVNRAREGGVNNEKEKKRGREKEKDGGEARINRTGKVRKGEKKREDEARILWWKSLRDTADRRSSPCRRPEISVVMAPLFFLSSRSSSFYLASLDQSNPVHPIHSNCSIIMSKSSHRDDFFQTTFV